MVGVAAGVAVLLPFPFYWALWNHPQRWVDLCGRGADPCRRMAQVSHVLKALQLLSLASVASFSWSPPLCSVVLAFGQYLNFNTKPSVGNTSPSLHAGRLEPLVCVPQDGVVEFVNQGGVLAFAPHLVPVRTDSAASYSGCADERLRALSV